MSVLLPIAVVTLMVACNALFVAAEFATVGVRRSRVAQLAEAGNAQAERLLPIITDGRRLDEYIAACQIGITLSSLVLGAYGQATFGRGAADMLIDRGVGPTLATSAAAIGTLATLTTLQVVLGELVPKSLALQYPTQVSLGLVWPMRLSNAVLGPSIRVLNGSGILVLRAFGLPPADGHRHIHSPEEIGMLVAESRDGGLLDAEEHHRLSQALQLGRRTAEQLMVPRRSVQALDIETPAEDILDRAMRSPHSRLPVYRGTIDDVVGLIHIKDLAAHVAETGSAEGWQLLVRTMTVIPSSMSADRLVTELRARRARQALVIDEYGGVDGIVTLEDILWEFVGDVGDEFRPGEPSVERLPDGRIRVPGSLRVDEIEERLGLPWRADEASTVAGKVLEILGRVPSPGDVLAIDGDRVEVEAMAGVAILSVLVTPAPPDHIGARG